MYLVSDSHRNLTNVIARQDDAVHDADDCCTARLPRC